MTKPTSEQKHPTINLQWYEDLAEIFPVGIFFTDAAGKCLQVNRAWCEIAGMPAEKALGRRWVRAIHPEDLERVTTLWYESVRNNQPFHAEYRFCTPQGKTTWVVGRASVKRTKDGTVEGYIGTITDIDKTRQALDELEQSSSRIRTIIAHMPVILFAFDQHGHLCAWNHEAERITGYTASEMVGNPEAMNLLCPDPDYLREMFAAYRERGDNYRNWDWQLIAKDGTVKIITFSNLAKYYPIKGWSNWGVGVDITSYRRTEHELCERVKELNCLFKLSTLSNQQNLNLDFFFQDVVELLPESWQYPEITSARIIYGDSIFNTEKFAVTPWKLSRSLHVQGRKAGLIEIYYSEERSAAAEGPFLIEERLLLDEVALQISRTVSNMLARQDLALLDEMCAKNEQLENFSHTVSHDLKTPLTAINGYTELLSENLAQGNLAQARFCADRIAESTNRMEQRLDEILNLAKIGRTIGQSEEIDLKKLIEATLGMMAKRLTALRIAVEVDAELPTVVGDATRLREVIENLLENAIRYIGSEPNLISIGCRRQDTETIFYVKDNGIGIAPQNLESIFELFKRLNKTIDGHGLGLTITRRIIEAHGGRIWVESEGEGKGTCFCFTLGHVIDS